MDLLTGGWILAALRLPNGSITLGLAQIWFVSWIWMLLKRLLKVHSAVSQISIVSEFVLYPSNFDKILYSFINFERLYILVFCYFSPTLRLTTRNDQKAYFLHISSPMMDFQTVSIFTSHLYLVLDPRFCAGFERTLNKLNGSITFYLWIWLPSIEWICSLLFILNYTHSRKFTMLFHSIYSDFSFFSFCCMSRLLCKLS